MSMKNSSDTIGIRPRDLPACSAVPQPTALRLKIKRANQTVITRAVLLSCKFDSVWWLHSVLFGRLYSFSLGVTFHDCDSLPHYMECNMAHSGRLGSGPLQTHVPKMLFRVQFTEWCVGSWLELMAWHDFRSSWDLVCRSVTSPHVMEGRIWQDAFQSGNYGCQVTTVTFQQRILETGFNIRKIT